MKKIAVLAVVLSMVMSFAAFDAQCAEKGASAKAFEHASDEAVFNRVTDWFATRGKSPEERKAILTERRAIRAQKRAEKEVLKAQREAEKAARKSQKQMGETTKKMKGKMKGKLK